ncbi:hypothetical protein [Muricomes intestini]|jgi:hypothetical protein|uniref:Major membrane immunogen (Membrane-anchored lipoprotein) n=1 Tax=Muricomes intestini TaxID=1796634 RepID=A0A4R3KFI0_9FIRM|nr:hypothetical protein [Muricomes intestini]TCS82146.1 hypothetical protein EDD59_1027 [Muricomes intestini]HAX51981.1 hypothetical protein [Lachnospiraceae bacterium]HCR84312.1 hypothetical protein [Lachnospiraceae bacterium]
MKKTAALLLCVTLAAGALTACGGNKTETAKTEDKKTQDTKEETTDEGGAKTGLSVITSLAKSTPASEEDGLAQTDSTVVAVLVDADGKILDCKIDAAQTQISFSKEGKLVSDTAAEFKSKQELGADYGLGKASSIKKEWNEQADAFAEYAVGKTVDEVKGIAVSEEGVPTDEDLTSSVTIHVGDFVSGIEKAAANAKALGAGSSDKLGLGVTTQIANSKDATADEEGLAEAYSMYSAITTDADGKITSCYIDASQGDVNFDTKGAITSDLKAEVKAKQELGNDYGMKKASSIGKEWFEQADAFAEYAKGKTASEVGGIAVNDEGLASDEDLISSVTVHVSPFISVVEKAAENAK